MSTRWVELPLRIEKSYVLSRLTCLAMLRFNCVPITRPLCVRCKTTRPQEWTDKEKYKVVVHPKQRETPRDYYTPEKWMQVCWKGLDSRERKVHAVGTRDTLRSDPKEAEAISMEKFLDFQKSLSARG